MTHARLVGGLMLVALLGLPAETAAQVYRAGTPGVSDPVLVRQATPRYTHAAMIARIQGVVELEAVVQPDGSVGAVRVVKSLDVRHGLDEQAVAAVRQWQFRPALIGDRPVAMLVTLIMEFRLHNRDQADGTEAVPAGTSRAEGDAFPPVVVKSVTPRYTSEALRQKIQGQVTVEAVVDATGTVTDVTVVKSLDTVYGLDDAAVAAAREWRFQPGTVGGRPAPATITLVLDFRLH